MTSSTIPNRPVFRAQEVCEIAQVQPYVLKTWEAEFPDLGTSKTANGQRVYRRGDVERVLRLKDLLFKEGLTLAGARKRLAEEGLVPAEEPLADEDVAAMLDEEVRQQLREVRRGLQWVLGVLDGDGVTPEEFVLMSSDSPRHGKGRARRRGAGSTGSGKPAKPAKRAASTAKASRGSKRTAKATRKSRAKRR